jgi:hypothetical protein
MPADAPREQLASIAAVADDLDKLLDELFRTAAELKVILARESAEKGEPP